MKQPSKPFSNLRLLELVLCGLVLSANSYSQEIVTGPFLIRNGITYHQDTNEPITGIVEKFSDNSLLQSRANYRDGEEVVQTIFNYFENGQLDVRGNYTDGVQDGLVEFFDEDGNLTETRTYRNGELIEENLNP